jgi:hypothetical protein
MEQDNYPRPNTDRARIAITFVYIMIVLYAIGMIATYYMDYVLRNGRDVSSVQSLVAVIGVAHLGLFIFSIIYFIQWFRRAYNNLYIVGSSKLSFGEGWASGGWFVPIVSLGRPYRIMKEIWTETQLIGRPLNDPTLQYSEPMIVGWYWTFWLLGNFTSNIATQMKLRGMEYDGDVYMACLSNVFFIIAGLMLVNIVKTISVWEDEMAQRYQRYMTSQYQQSYTQEQNDVQPLI